MEGLGLLAVGAGMAQQRLMANPIACTDILRARLARDNGRGGLRHLPADEEEQRYRRRFRRDREADTRRQRHVVEHADHRAAQEPADPSARPALAELAQGAPVLLRRPAAEALNRLDQ